MSFTEAGTAESVFVFKAEAWDLRKKIIKHYIERGQAYTVAFKISCTGYDRRSYETFGDIENKTPSEVFRKHDVNTFEMRYFIEALEKLGIHLEQPGQTMEADQTSMASLRVLDFQDYTANAASVTEPNLPRRRRSIPEIDRNENVLIVKAWPSRSFYL